AESRVELKLNSTCVVFAESEIIGMMADNVHAADIARAVHNSIARRVFAQISALDYHPPIIFTGGVAQNADLRYCLEQALGQEILCPPEPEITGALGAAILVV
ncbi:MAG: BadF/BadG/BcrA/BcrD ATPase family protein, partial [Candidatus Cloacimonadaceae bacterium]|nr:BadF/BadG/BcrA/BcrD ATPase family protein [Candidatus Cloacimonadaceae bacterium]